MHARTIVLGTRGSALARIQTQIAAEAIARLDPAILIETRVIETTGDINQSPIPLDTVGKGWFTKEIEQSLLQNEIDVAVHSLKDMAEDMPAGLHIGAYLSREDARDVLVCGVGTSLHDLKIGARIGTDSARRQLQMLALRPDVEMRSMRGNVNTRLAKLDAREYDAAILAAAGLLRLGLSQQISHYFPIAQFTPAPGQGILALQSRINDAEITAVLAAISIPEVARIAQLERAFSRAIGGGCKSPTGAYAEHVGDYCVLTGMIAGASTVIRKTTRAPWPADDALATSLADELLAERA